MENVIKLLKRFSWKVFTTSQKVLMNSALFFIYFFVFGWFSLVAKFLERNRLKKDKISKDSFWLKPALKTPDRDSCFNQS